MIPAVLVSFMAAYAIIRDGRRWFLRSVNWLFLMGLAIPLQATIIPIYLMIIKLKLYDTLLALILPSIAFAIPLSVLVLSNFIRDVPASCSSRCGWTARPSGRCCGAWRSR